MVVSFRKNVLFYQKQLDRLGKTQRRLIANSTIWFGIWADQTGLTSFGKIYELLSWTRG